MLNPTHAQHPFRNLVGLALTAIFGLAFLVLAAPSAAAPNAGGVPSLEKQDRPEFRLVVPFFEVDTNNPAGATTLFAVRNPQASDTEITIHYYDGAGNSLRTDTVPLAAEATHTVNVRDVGLPAGPDGVARGFILIETATSRNDIVGDFFQVDVGQNFATGERMFSSFCPITELRFADFGEGTEITVLLTDPLGTDPNTAPPTFAVTPVDEAGNAGTPVEIYTDQHLYFASASDFTQGSFGTLIFDFTPRRGVFGSGWAYAVYSAGGRFSVGMGMANSAAARRCPSLTLGSARLDLSALVQNLSETPAPDAPGPEDHAHEITVPAPATPKIGTGTITRLILPFYEVDKNDASGTTTLYAIRNLENYPVDIEIRYYRAASAAAVRTETVTLAANATRTVNLRDVPGLTTDSDGFARGFATIETLIDARILGDFFQVDVGQNFATGDRLVSQSNDLCEQQEIRFADFGSGTQLMVLLTNPQGIGAGAPPSFRVTPVDEDGNRLPSTDLQTSRYVNFYDASDFTGESFGTLIFDFSINSSEDQGWVYGVYSADGLFSVGVNGVQNPFKEGVVATSCRSVLDFPQP